MLVLVPRGGAGTAACAGPRGLGPFVFMDRGALRVADLSRCTARTLVDRGVTPPVRLSGDGRFVAYGDGLVVPIAGGTPSRPLRARTPGWTWVPGTHELVGVTRRGGM